MQRRDFLRLGLGGAAVMAVKPSLILPTRGGAAPTLRPRGVPQVDGMRVLAGSLHDHSTDSDGDTASPVVEDWLYRHRLALGIDFATISDHSDLFPVAYAADPGTEMLNPWIRQAALSSTYSGRDFTLLRGFEWTNDQENHLNVIGSQNWTSRFVTGDTALRMQPFWEWLATPPVADPSGAGLGFGGADGIGQFNHPGDKGALNWDDYAYDERAAALMCTIEIHGSQDANGQHFSDAGWYWFALSQGWNVSPVMNWDWHVWRGGAVITNDSPGGGWGTHGYLPGQRSLILAPDPTRPSLLAALRARRTSATERPDLWATLRGPGKVWQGSRIAGRPGETLKLVVDAGSSADNLTSVDIVSDNGVSPYPYYYGDNVDCPAPTTADPTGAFSCNPNGFVHDQLTASYAEQHARYVATNGHATRKARIDQPPPGTTVASAALSGTRARTVIHVRVPDAPSPRPDGLHWFYAVVSSGQSRVWTAPLLAG